jgi:Holliday junction resolvase RusA-like endonuclease
VRIVRRYRSARYELDHDNLVGGCKPLVDALVKVGLIADDRPGLVTVTYEQERGAGCRVEVRAPGEIAGGA